MPDQSLHNENESEIYILIKAAPVISDKHGETVCCAGIDVYGNWVRLYPVSFRVLSNEKQFKRWDLIRFKWRKPADDNRIESRRLNDQSLKIVGEMPKLEREDFLHNQIVTSLNKEREAGRSLALLKPRIKSFKFEKRTVEQLAEQQRKIDNLHSQYDMLNPHPDVPQQACPYRFTYKYETDDGKRDGTCQDWETEATFFKWRQLYGEEKALKEMQLQFGERLPEKGLLFAMGTHSQYPDTWLVNGLIQLSETRQGNLF